MQSNAGLSWNLYQVLNVEDEHVLHTKKSTSEKITNGQNNEFSVNNDEEIVCTGMDESLDLEVIDDHDRSLKLPSPPPPPDILVVNKNSTKGITKKTRKALKTLENAKALLEDSGDTDSCYLDSYDLTSPIREDIIIKVNCRGEVLRLEAKKSEPFSSIIKKIAKLKNVESKQIKLYRNEESENSITDYDTPASLNLTVADILCCLIVSKYSNYSHISTIDQKKSGGFKLFVQSQNSRENKVEIEIEKTHHLQELMFKYASIKKSDISKFRFVFDGEDISPLETAEDLAMEDGDTIDAVEISAIEIS